MPALQLYIDPAGDGENFIQRAQLRSGSEGWRHEVPDNFCVEGVSRNAHAGVANDVARDSASAANVRADMNKGEVTGAASEIADQNKFIMIERGFIIMRSGHRLHFEFDGLKAC